MRTDVYKSKAWKRVRLNVCLRQGCLCARCSRPVYVDGISQWIPKEKRLKGIVHHKEYLTEENYMDDSVAYDEDNLELLCIDCHNREHYLRATRKDVRFDEDGNLVPINNIDSIKAQNFEKGLSDGSITIRPYDELIKEVQNN